MPSREGDMLAVRYHRYGGAEELRLDDVPEPHAGPGEVRIRVAAAGVNPIDYKLREGMMAGGASLESPTITGLEAAGVVDEVGDGVTGTAVGDAVFGFTAGGAAAEYAVLSHWAHQPDNVSAVAAGGFSLVSETAARVLRELDVKAGDVILVHGASGGVGQAALQLAREAGVTVIGTAGEANHDLVRSLGATPTTYSDGLPARVTELAADGVTGVFDAAGTSLDELLEIAGDPARIVTIANFAAAGRGVRVSGGGARAYDVLDEVADLASRGLFAITVADTFPLADAASAHTLAATGHAGGKVVLTVD